MSIKKKLGFGFDMDLSKVNFLNGSKPGVSLDTKELNIIAKACDVREEDVLDSIVASKDKKTCAALILIINEGLRIKDIIDVEARARNLVENRSLKVEFTDLQYKFILQSLELYIKDLKSNIKGVKDANFDSFCIKIAEATVLHKKINDCIHMEEVESVK